ncbi:MAG: rod shape-determining protein RodA [Flavobacteriaceae bacterium]|nr:rod shape-determining protein RodA [Flavobacteriaceae bacterium]|tara:strand:- start:8160 stop:9413 length:1254 start_codon:yes stop_codon:yes gene_type:complete
MTKSIVFRMDWLSLIIYLLLVIFGIINIYSTTLSEVTVSLFDMNSPAGKQFWIFIFSLIFLPIILFINSNFFEHLSLIFYILSILSLLGLFFFGQKISGATSWYFIGGFSLQPSEFAKITTSLLVASTLSSIQADIKNFSFVTKLLLIIGLPMILVIFQPDAGTALVFLGLFFVLLREGMDMKTLYFGMGFISLFILTLIFGPLMLSIALFFILILVYRLILQYYPKTKKTPFVFLYGISVLFNISVNFIFNSVFEQRHRDRFNIMLGLENDTQGIGYNINQSKIAIGSGGFSGKGFLNGTQTKGGFVPEQHTDYIFSTVGEEWGFIGSSGLIILFTVLISRILYRAEKHTQSFPRMFSYCFASMLFVHFFVNIGMTLGLVPTVGIPLTFISYGGTNLMAFSLMLFIYLNLDANRLN